MQQIFIRPDSPLSPFVERFWYSSEGPAHQKVRVVPSGTMELVFNLGEDELGILNTEKAGSYQSFSGAFFAGAYGRPVFVDTRRHVLGVHFRPGGAARFLGIPASGLTNIHVDLEGLWGRTNLREQLCGARNSKECFRILERALVARLKDGLDGHPAVGAALEILKREAGKIRTRELAAHLGLSQRRFIQLFSNQVGVTPKVFGRVQRFQHAVELTRSSGAIDWADVAVECGYFDQSHLIHEFEALSGLSPTEFQRQRRERLLMSAPISE